MSGDAPKPTYCEACRRPRWRGPQMSLTTVSGAGRVLLCDDPTDCRLAWPAESYTYGRVAA